MTAVLHPFPIEAAVRSLFPETVAVAVRAIGVGHDDRRLSAEERSYIAKAVPARRAEFIAGRLAARQALARLGHHVVAIPADTSRAPVWPQGLAGSITHGAGIAIAVARLGEPLGIDIETDTDIEPDLWPVICSADERAILPKAMRGRLVRHVFAAKEAVYKAQDPGRRALFDFHAVHLRLTDDGFVATFPQAAGSFAAGQVVLGRLAFVQGLVIAGVAES